VGEKVSGGNWGYQEHHLNELADETRIILQAVAKTEHIVDWAISGDTLIEDASRQLFELWRETFNNLWER